MVLLSFLVFSACGWFMQGFVVTLAAVTGRYSESLGAGAMTWPAGLTSSHGRSDVSLPGGGNNHHKKIKNKIPRLIQKLWPIWVTWLAHRRRYGAQRGTQSRGAHTPAHPAVHLHHHTLYFFLIETPYSRSVSTFSTAIFFKRILCSF